MTNYLNHPISVKSLLLGGGAELGTFTIGKYQVRTAIYIHQCSHKDE